MRDKHMLLRRFLSARFSPGGAYGRQLTLGVLVLALATWIFATIAEEVVTHDSLVLTDLAVTQWFQLHTHPALTRAMWYFTQLHGNLGIAIMTAIFAFFLYWRSHHFWVVALVSSVFGGMLLNALLKLIFQRPRPVLDHPLLTLTTHSFPSGHTLNATVFYGLLAAFLIARQRSISCRLTAPLLAVLMISLVATSRVYLGVHFLSDVLASVAEGIAWLALCLTAINTSRLRRSAL